MGFGFQTSKRLGFKYLHIKFNGSKRGISITVKVGPLSFNTRRPHWRLDLIGPLFWRSSSSKR